MPSRALLVLLPVVLACSSEPARLARAQVDTLPSGIVQVTSEEPTGWADSAHAWRLVEELRFSGEEGTPSELIAPRSLAVDEAGRIYVADDKPAVVKVYDRSGRLVRTLGKEGEGPGEFRVGLLAIRDWFLVLHDPQVARTSVWDTSGSFLGSWRSACCFWTAIAVDTAGRAYVPSMAPGEGGPGVLFLRYEMDGSLVDTMPGPLRREDAKRWVIRTGSGENRAMAMTSVPYTAQVEYGFHPYGGLVIGWSGDYMLARTPTGRDTTLLFGRRWTPEPLAASRKQAIVDSMIEGWDWVDPALLRATFKPEDIPSTLPAFESLSVDDAGNVWVRVGTGPRGVRYDVFAPGGAWLGETLLPAAFQRWGAQHFGRDAAVIATEDEDGRPVIIRYRIQKR